MFIYFIPCINDVKNIIIIMAKDWKINLIRIRSYFLQDFYIFPKIISSKFEELKI